MPSTTRAAAVRWKWFGVYEKINDEEAWRFVWFFGMRNLRISGTITATKKNNIPTLNAEIEKTKQKKEDSEKLLSKLRNSMIKNIDILKEKQMHENLMT